jgi:hypothetical protein
MKYGSFTVFHTGHDEWSLVVGDETHCYRLDTNGFNMYGRIVRIAKTADKAVRIMNEYMRRMGRL